MRPRTKDAQSRYTCRECFDALQRQAAARPHQMAAPAAPAAQAEVEPAEDPAFMAALLGGAADQAAPAVRPCPECGHPLGHEVVVCTHCGFNTRTGRTLSTRQAVGVEADPAAASQRDRRRAYDEREAQRIARAEMIKPIIIGAVALGGVIAMLAAQAKNTEFLAIDKYIVFYLGSVAAAALVFSLACLVRVGRDSLTVLNFVRLAAIVAAVDLLRVPIVLAFGTTFLLWAALLLAYICFLALLMELDISDAVVIGVPLGAAQIAAGFLIVAPLLR